MPHPGCALQTTNGQHGSGATRPAVNERDVGPEVDGRTSVPDVPLARRLGFPSTFRVKLGLLIAARLALRGQIDADRVDGNACHSPFSTRRRTFETAHPKRPVPSARAIPGPLHERSPVPGTFALSFIYLFLPDNACASIANRLRHCFLLVAFSHDRCPHWIRSFCTVLCIQSSTTAYAAAIKCLLFISSTEL